MEKKKEEKTTRPSIRRTKACSDDEYFVGYSRGKYSDSGKALIAFKDAILKKDRK